MVIQMSSEVECILCEDKIKTNPNVVSDVKARYQGYYYCPRCRRFMEKANGDIRVARTFLKESRRRYG